MLLGTAKQCITPNFGVKLCGFTGRIGTFEKVEHDIFIRAHLFCEDDKKVMFIYGDLLWWQYSFVEKAKALLSNKIDIPVENIIFNASHSHGGPPTGADFSHLLEDEDVAYAQFLLQKVLILALDAFSNLEEVTGKRIDDNVQLNVFRRKIIDNVVQMKPNYDVEADSRISLMVFTNKNGDIKAIGSHYACHANICGDNILQPDYVGVALSALEEKHPSAICFFWQGCTADLRPNCVIGEDFQRQPFTMVQNFANQFANKCEQMLSQEGVKLNCLINIQNSEINLPLENVCTLENAKKELETEENITKQAWLQSIIKNNCRDSVPLKISRISLAKELICYTFSAEVSQYYAQFVRQQEPNALCIAYANGMAGYICTAEQIEQGGYEPDESALFFALAGTYPPKIEEQIHNQIIKLTKIKE